MTVKRYSGGSSGENGRIAAWGVDEAGSPSVDVYRADAALRLAKQGDVFPKWVDNWVIENAGRKEA